MKTIVLAMTAAVFTGCMHEEGVATRPGSNAPAVSAVVAPPLDIKTKPGSVDFDGLVARLPFGLVLERQDYIPLTYKTFEEFSETNEYREQMQALTQAINEDSDIRELVTRISKEHGYEIAGKVCLTMALQSNPFTSLSPKAEYWINWFKRNRTEVIDELKRLTRMDTKHQQDATDVRESTIVQKWNLTVTESARKLTFRVYTEPGQELTVDLSQSVQTVDSTRRYMGPLEFRTGVTRASYSNEMPAFIIVRKTDHPRDLPTTNVYPDPNAFPDQGVLFYGGKDYTGAVKKVLQTCVPVTFISDKEALTATFYVKRESQGQRLSNADIVKEIARYLTTGKFQLNANPLLGLRMAENKVESEMYNVKTDRRWKVTTDPAGNEGAWATSNTKSVMVQAALPDGPLPVGPYGKCKFKVMTIGIPQLNRGKSWELAEVEWAKPDPYYVVKYGRFVEYTSKVVADSLNPKWEEEFTLTIPQGGDGRTFTLTFWDYDYGWIMFNPADKIGEVTVDTRQLREGKNDYPVNEDKNGVTGLRLSVFMEKD